MTRRRLDTELVRRKLASTRSEARRLIDDGRVRVSGNPEPKPATLVAPDDSVHLASLPEPFVSRAGRKLAHALNEFDVDVTNRRAIDVGASTGGFTDCLLQRGTSQVTAIDVGYGQLHWSLRKHPGVVVVERTNIRTADAAALGAPFDVVVADLAFISLRLVADKLAELGADDADWVVLIKPQFEAGRTAVGKGGVVRDREVRRSAVAGVIDTFAEVGLGLCGLVASPIAGTTGNIEYVAWFRRGAASVALEDMFDALKEPPR
ncbi:MAG: TlyA family RNA methyltransferase [Acidimicrobiia bacterium]